MVKFRTVIPFRGNRLYYKKNRMGTKIRHLTLLILEQIFLIAYEFRVSIFDSRSDPYHGLEMKIATVFEETAFELSSVFNFVTKLRNFRDNIFMIMNFLRRKYINFEVISGRNFVQGYGLDNFIKFQI